MNQLYQTLEDRSNPDEIESYGPFKCRTATSWLGDGYYFWDSILELAHFWGKNSTYSNYIICSAEAELNDGNCYDLVGNINHLKDLRAITELMEKEGIENLTIRKVAEQAKYNSATLYHYFLGNILVFTSGARYEKGKELSLVFAVSIMGLAFNLILMYIFVGMMLLQPMFAKVLASCIVVIWNYLARKKWIF